MDFAQAARLNSISASAPDGGDLGFVMRAPYPRMQTAIANLEKDGISSVFKGPEGYYIVKVEDKRGGQTKPFLDVSEDIISGLTLMKQQQAVLDYLDKLQEKFHVQINQELVDEVLGE
jgi:parvulin-like peptidyl-prolyl isomerase